jgi:hypothetical protein
MDECVPRKVKFLFAGGGHECETVRNSGFSGKENGERLALVEEQFDILVTIDKNIRYQAKPDGPEHRYLDHPPSFERSG